MTTYGMFFRNIAFSLLFLFFIIGCSQQPKLHPIPSGSSILAFGDSVTFGTGAQKGEDWPTLLSQKTGWDIINAGIPGDTAEQGKNRIHDLLSQYRPVLVIIEMGGNDFLKRTPQQKVKEDIRQIIQAVKGVGAQAVLVAVPEVSLLNILTSKNDAPIYKELGNEEKVVVITNVLSTVLSKPELCADQIHPNAKGYQEMADGIHRAFKKAGAL